MIEKVTHIKNPLTIIAIFACIAEISGTIVLPLLENNNQSVFMWFVMIFPILLVILFFFTLNYQHSVLYAPTDFSDQKEFRLLIQLKNQKFANPITDPVDSIIQPSSETYFPSNYDIN